ncbi:putative quinol monooxygenase [Acidipropionibacterium virtanenii]|uniref:(4S)-4-hydroxy-5-phosphonooxypentane-2,3-dione isomerase n=1 Tax=Acidipropionibacterium virtanenii TaxID=2057246 RepID=A0A344UQK3_9ACTN|nr:putative quinol monooxygenase [Acidipropionibacterium virtanenii]AXE37551.1 (4S)-4-hydroxy-5-phosphonooxypentane-2,3-dione isomerase [Acidipropionibacterium virtanenii]
MRTGTMRTLHAEFTAKPGCAEEIAERLAEYGRSVRAEPGNVIFAPNRREDDPDRFFVFEAYADEEAFQTHLAAPYGGPFNEALGPLIREPASVLTLLTPVE